jgi:hypothetical protein
MMKKYLDALPASFALFFLIYIAINPTSPGPIVGFVASACLFAYQQYLFKLEQPDIMAELAKVRAELDSKVIDLKEKAGKEITELRDDVAKFSLNMVRPQNKESVKERQKVQF